MADVVRDVDRATLVQVRHLVSRYAAAHGLSNVALYRFVVAVNEILANAVQHGGGSGRVELWTSDTRLYCRVTDHGPGLPADLVADDQPRPPVRAVAGRGLWLARQSCPGLVVLSTSDGTTVTLHADVPYRPATTPGGAGDRNGGRSGAGPAGRA